jgi:hypothetical protein
VMCVAENVTVQRVVLRVLPVERCLNASLYLRPFHIRRTVLRSLELSESNALSDVGDNWIEK